MDRANNELQWLHNGTVLLPGTKYSLNHDRTKLTVSNIEHSDEGNYSCRYVSATTNSYTTEIVGCLLVYGMFYKEVYMYVMQAPATKVHGCELT